MIASAACTGEPQDLFGTYELSSGGDRTATLELIRPDIYRFCLAGECNSGTFALTATANDGTGRIAFRGAEFEAFADRLFADIVGEREVRNIKGPSRGSIELSYTVNGLGSRIHIEPASDADFIKR